MAGHTPGPITIRCPFRLQLRLCIGRLPLLAVESSFLLSSSVPEVGPEEVMDGKKLPGSILDPRLVIFFSFSIGSTHPVDWCKGKQIISSAKWCPLTNCAVADTKKILASCNIALVTFRFRLDGRVPGARPSADRVEIEPFSSPS